MHKAGCDEGGGRKVGNEKVKRMRVDGREGSEDGREGWEDGREGWEDGNLAAGFFFFEHLWAGTLTEMTHSSFLLS